MERESLLARVSHLLLLSATPTALHCSTVYIQCGIHPVSGVMLYLPVQVQEMYFAMPPRTPDLDFYRESFEVLIKYNDR